MTPNSSSDSSSELINAHRLICVFSFVMLIFIGFLPQPPNTFAIEPLWERIAVSSYFLVIFILSFTFPFIRNSFTYFIYIGLYLVFGWHVRLASLNHFSLYYALSLFVGLSGSSVFFRQFRSLLFFYTYAILTVAFSLYYSPAIQVNPLTYLAYLASVCFIYFIVFSLRIRSQNQLTQSKDSLSTVFEESADALFTVDLATLKTISCNQRAVSLFEVNSKTDLVGVELNSWLKKPFPENEVQRIISLIRSQGHWQGELQFVTAKKREFWGDFYVKITTLLGKEVYYVRISDITSRKQALNLLQTRTQELEQLNSFMVGRELKLVQLKKEISDLKKSLAAVDDKKT